MHCTQCGELLNPGDEFCAKCGHQVGAQVNPSTETMDGAEALAYTGHRLSLSRDAWQGYRLSQQALEALEAEGKGDTEAADMARRGMRNVKIKWWIGGVVVVFFLILFISGPLTH